MSRSPVRAGVATVLVAALVTVPGAARADTAPAPECGSIGRVYIARTPFALLRLGSRRVWQRSTGAGVVVAVIDSGVDPRNPHLAGVVLPGSSELPGDRDQKGWTDDAGHGTAVAGIIAARQVAGSGIVGLARDARILPIRIFAGTDQGSVAAGLGLTTARIAAGIRRAADLKAPIINVSISQVAPSPLLDQAVAYAHAKGSLVVASAGNRTTSTDKEDVPHYPGGSPFALGVGAFNTADDVSPDSVRGRHVDLLGPGSAVATSYRNLGDCLLDANDASTSWATAYVSAAAALIKQAYPTAGPDEIAYRLEASAARPLRGARDDGRGWGLVQPLEAITMTLDPTRPGPPLPGSAVAPAVPEPKVDQVNVQTIADPLRQPRQTAVWLLLLGALGVALALMAGRLVKVRGRRAASAG